MIAIKNAIIDEVSAIKLLPVLINDNHTTPDHGRRQQGIFPLEKVNCAIFWSFLLFFCCPPPLEIFLPTPLQLTC